MERPRASSHLRISPYITELWPQDGQAQGQRSCISWGFQLAASSVLRVTHTQKTVTDVFCTSLSLPPPLLPARHSEGTAVFARRTCV